MIRSFRHKGLQRFFETGSTAGIKPEHAGRLRLQLTVLETVTGIHDLPGSWKPHFVVGTDPAGRRINGHVAIAVTGNWRLVFQFVGQDVELLDYMDYH